MGSNPIELTIPEKNVPLQHRAEFNAAKCLGRTFASLETTLA